MAKDTLERIALDWDKGLIPDGEARRRAADVPRPVRHADATPFGDGGWLDGDPADDPGVVDALEYAGRIGPGRADAFWAMLDPEAADAADARRRAAAAAAPLPGIIDWPGADPR